MRKTVVSLAVVSTIALAGCNNTSDNSVPEPTSGPVVTVEPSEKPTEGSTSNPEPQPTKTRERTQEPTTPASPVPTTTEAGTPQTQFAQRWGQRYPQVPEFAILKAANRVCDAISAVGPEWVSDPFTKNLIQEAVNGFGISGNDGVEFAQDAEQNYCSSQSNPT
jgi:hypothetical protein